MLQVRIAALVALAGSVLAVAAAPKRLPGSKSIPARQIKQARQQYDAGRRAEQRGDWPLAYELYDRAAVATPENSEYQFRLWLARFHLVQARVTEAERDAVSGQLESARQELEDALALDPSYPVARERLEEIDQMLANQPANDAQPPPRLPQIQPQPGSRRFDYRGDTEGAYQEIARQFGVSAVFDPEMPHRQIRFQVAGVDFPTAMRLLSEMTGTFWRSLGPRMFFVTGNNPAKVREYAPSVVKTLLLGSSQSPGDMEQTARIVRDIAALTRTELDSAAHTLTVRGTPDKVALAAELVHEIEQPRGEVVLELDILEVDRDFARQLGITPPNSAQVFTISPSQLRQAQQSLEGLIGVITQVFGQPSTIAGLQAGQIQSLLGSGHLNASTLVPPVVVFGGGKTLFFNTLPGAVAQLAESLNLVQSGQQMLLRSEDGEPATFFVGDRFPVSLASLSSSLGSPALVPSLSTSSFPTSTFPTGKKPAAVAAGDFNGDTFPDLAVANQADDTVSILLNNGSGSFTAGQVIPVQSSPVSIATVDFNGDGKLDLAVANRDSNTVSILLGGGDGKFTAAGEVPVGQGPVAVAAADFNGDGKLDLAVANQSDNTISILVGNGDGTFQPQVQIPVGTTPVALATGDFNGDGKIDLAVVDQGDNQVLVLPGNGDGTFSPGHSFATGSMPAAIVAADFNGDGKTDLAVANENDNTVSLLIGKGDGTFQQEIAFATAKEPVAMAEADFNSSGFASLAVVCQASNTVSVLLNDGSGNLTNGLSLPVGNNPDAIALADFDKNGRPDAAVANQSDNNVSVILNDITLVRSSTATATPYPGFEFVDLGLKVTATPRLHPGGEVTLKMNVEIRGLTPQDVNGIPILTNRTFEQTVRLKEGEATLIASALEPQETLTLTGWPGLAALGARNARNQNTELVIVARPRLIRMPKHIARTIYAGVGAAENQP
ncbi:MAG TPA: FG-GAP-like repeat-containing protein [Candidatus Acidoferrales bacterium]|nr:FG-GAP-like repeat-containing protein [Candidatus Acidoferrales bacterium]